MLKLNDLNPQLRERIQRQISAEDAAKACDQAKADCNQRVAGLVRPEPEQIERRASQDSRLVRGQKIVGYRILIVSYRKRRLDSHDNLRTAHKPIVDRITERLGCRSDDDPRLEWNYAQVTKSKIFGTHIIIQPL